MEREANCLNPFLVREFVGTCRRAMDDLRASVLIPSWSGNLLEPEVLAEVGQAPAGLNPFLVREFVGTSCDRNFHPLQ